MTSEYEELRYTVEQVEKRAEGAHGRIDSVNGRIAAFEFDIVKLTRLVTNALEYMQAVQNENRRSANKAEEDMAATRRIAESMDERQGRILREIAMLREEISR